jgi:hypothetical protein
VLNYALIPGYMNNSDLAREKNQREKSKIFPAEGVTMYFQPCDKKSRTSTDVKGGLQKQTLSSAIKGHIKPIHCVSQWQEVNGQ